MHSAFFHLHPLYFVLVEHFHFESVTRWFPNFELLSTLMPVLNVPGFKMEARLFADDTISYLTVATDTVYCNNLQLDLNKLAQ